MFRFLLEAQDNLAVMTVVDRWAAVLMVRCSPDQERDLDQYLKNLQESLDFEILPWKGLR